jgi:O-antigen/teichoic acid export membrane protein
MAGIRRALVLASGGRYIVTAINLATTVVMARLLTPGEYGLAALGIAAYGIAEALRELGGGAYLVQQKELDSGKIRTTVTVSAIVTVVITAALIVLAGPMARYYGTPELEPYLHVIALWYVTGPLVYPVLALMWRELAFGRIALIGVVTAAVNGGAAIALALAGFSYMSFAWASVISGVAGMLLGLACRPDFSIFRPLLTEWRGVLAFSTYDSATAVLGRVFENLPYFIFGRFLDASAVGLYQRTIMLCQFPERVILAGVGAVALPAFSRQAREGGNLKEGYLDALGLITAVQWPALILLALLAHPVVALVLGGKWLEAVPLLQIISTALLFNFATSLTYPVLVAAGAIRHMPGLTLAQGAFATSVLFVAVHWGLHAAALSSLLTVPVNMLLAVGLVRRHVPFRWGELAAALTRSAIVTVASAAGPVMIVMATGWRLDLSPGATLLAVLLCAAGWLAALGLTRHPVWLELGRAVARRRPASAPASDLAARPAAVEDSRAAAPLAQKETVAS